MDASRFVAGIEASVYRTTIDGVAKLLRSPPGRNPRADLVSMSAWFNGLDERDAEQVRQVIRLSVDQAVFGLLAVLDGSRAIDDEGVDLSLRSGSVVINGEGDLHAQFRGLVDEELGHD